MQDTIPSLVANTYIAIENMLLMATGLGLGTCWVGGYTEWQKINAMFDLPVETMMPIGVVTVGYPENGWPKAHPRRPLIEMVKWV